MSQPAVVGIQMNGLDNGATPASGTPPNQRPQEQSHMADWKRNNDVLLIVATLITTLTYQVGTNLPRGYYQDDDDGHSAGDSILRDNDPFRYWLFIAASWVGFGNSMLMTLALLTGVSVESRLIRWSFVAAYSSLVFTFITSLPKTTLSYDILLWVIVLFFLWVAISFKWLKNTVFVQRRAL